MNRLREIWKNSTGEEKLLWLYVILLPLMDLPLCIFAGKKVLAADAIFVILLGSFLLKILLKKIRFTLTSIGIPLFIMISLFSISLFNSVSIISGFAELFSLVYLTLLFLLIINIITDKNKLIHLLYIWLSVALIVSLVGLATFCVSVFTRNLTSNLFLSYTPMDAIAHHFPRICSTFVISNMFFAYLHVSFVFAIILFLLEPSLKKKTFLSLCIIIILISSFFSGSRRFAGLLLSIFLLFYLYGKGRLAYIFKYITFFGFLVFLIAYIATSIWVIFPIQMKKDASLKTLSLTVESSYSLHLLSPVVSINMIKKHPIIGVGLGTYNKHFGDYVDWEWVKSNFGLRAYPGYIKSIEERTLNFDPHSLYLGTFAETGLLGLMGLIYFLIKYLGLLLKRIEEPGYFNLSKIVSGCIVSGYIGFLLSAMTIDILSMRHFWFMLAIGLVSNLPEKV